ncbi:hypothetical protein SAMN06295967_1511, partial [Belliella buryatensis]
RDNDGANTDASDFNEVLGLTDVTEEESDKLKDLISEGAEVETISDLRELLDQIRKLEDILTDIRDNDGANTDASDFNEVLGLTDITEEESDKLKDLISEGAEVETISDLRELLDQIRKLEDILTDIRDNDGANTDETDFNELLGLTDITEEESDKLKDLISEGAEVETVSDLRELLDQIRKLEDILTDIRDNEGADTDQTDFNDLLGLTDITSEESDKLKDLIQEKFALINIQGVRDLLEVIRTQKDVELLFVLPIADLTYNGKTQFPEISIIEGEKLLKINLDYTITYNNNLDAGIGEVLITGLGNYIGTRLVNFKILPATLTIKANNQSKIYDLEDPVFTYTVTGLIGSDQLIGKLSREA